MSARKSIRLCVTGRRGTADAPRRARLPRLPARTAALPSTRYKTRLRQCIRRAFDSRRLARLQRLQQAKRQRPTSPPPCSSATPTPPGVRAPSAPADSAVPPVAWQAAAPPIFVHDVAGAVPHGVLPRARRNIACCLLTTRATRACSSAFFTSRRAAHLLHTSKGGADTACGWRWAQKAAAALRRCVCRGSAFPAYNQRRCSHEAIRSSARSSRALNEWPYTRSSHTESSTISCTGAHCSGCGRSASSISAVLPQEFHNARSGRVL
jgi:hypothetical protein